MRTALINATLIDCVDPTPKTNTTVIVEDGRIKEILSGEQAKSVTDAQQIDLAGAYGMCTSTRTTSPRCRTCRSPTR